MTENYFYERVIKDILNPKANDNKSKIIQQDVSSGTGKPCIRLDSDVSPSTPKGITKYDELTLDDERIFLNRFIYGAGKNDYIVGATKYTGMEFGDKDFKAYLENHMKRFEIQDCLNELDNKYGEYDDYKRIYTDTKEAMEDFLKTKPDFKFYKEIDGINYYDKYTYYYLSDLKLEKVAEEVTINKDSVSEISKAEFIQTFADLNSYPYKRDRIMISELSEATLAAFEERQQKFSTGLGD